LFFNPAERDKSRKSGTNGYFTIFDYYKIGNPNFVIRLLLFIFKNMDQNKNQNQNQASGLDDLDLELTSVVGGEVQSPVTAGIPAEKKDSGQSDESGNSKERERKETVKKTICFSESKIAIVKKILSGIKDESERALELLGGEVKFDEKKIMLTQAALQSEMDDREAGAKIIEGIFDGEKMIGPDGKQYSVPANYASKSKLIEGDTLKLIITPSGAFIYKQIGPIERSRVMARLKIAPDGNFYAVSGDKIWRLLAASVTYFQGQEGDEVAILIPKAGESRWAAVENIIRKEAI